MSIRWPWHRHEVDEHAMEESRQALRDAQVWEARARRVSRATERAIIQNHFAMDIKRAMEDR